jgi:hypothetical protein
VPSSTAIISSSCPAMWLVGLGRFSYRGIDESR